MKSFIRLILSLGVFSTLVASIAVPEAIALPWAQANPQAYAAASAYADAYAEAVAIGHPDPEAYALAASADDCATIACHASCGLLIIEGTKCSTNTENTYAGPYNTTCLCAANSGFLKYYSPCMECGWTLWKYYSGYVTSALEACSTLSTEPTGTSRCSTTLSDSYTIDTSIQGCSYLGNCPTNTASSTVSSSSASSSASSSVASTSSSSSSSATAATSSSTSKSVSPVTTYTGTTHTVTTDLSFTYSYSPGGETTDCFTTSYNYPVATNNPIDIDFVSWDDKHYNTDNYTTYFFFNFTSDQSDVTDIQLITGTDRSTAVLTPDSQIWVNLQQGIMGFVTSAQNNMAAYNLGILVTYKGENYLYAYSCLTDRLTLKYLQISKDDYSSCFRMSYWGFWNDGGYCTFRDSPITTTVQFRPTDAAIATSASSSSLSSSSSVASSSSSSVSSIASSSEVSSVASSSEASSVASSSEVSSVASSSEVSSVASSSEASSVAPSSEASSVASSSSVSSESSEASSSTSSIASSVESSVASSAASSEPSIVSSTESSTASSATSSSAEFSASSISSSDSSASVTESSSISSSESSVASFASSISSSSSAAASSLAAEPELSGALVDGEPQWSLNIPGALGPWTSVSLVASKNVSGSFNYDNAQVLVNGQVVTDVTPTVSDASIELSFTFSVGENDQVVIEFGGQIVGGSSFTALATLTIDTPNGRRVKRAENSWDLSNTITLDAASSSSASSAASSAISSTSPVSSSSGVITSGSSVGYENSTSTAIVSDISTTLVTVTSCSEDKCSEVESTAQVSVATTTINGVVTSYTTYCPLTTEPQTTVVTVTSCHEDKCVEVPSTAQVSVATTTINGVVTSYTTYCPLTSTEAGHGATETGATETGASNGANEGSKATGAVETTAITTTVVTVTSCANGVCSEVPSTAQVTVGTTTNNGVASTYTTYGSVDSTKYVTEVVSQTESANTAGEESGAPSNGVTSTAAIGSTVQSVISTFEGAANMIAGSFIGVLFPFLFI